MADVKEIKYNIGCCIIFPWVKTCGVKKLAEIYWDVPMYSQSRYFHFIIKDKDAYWSNTEINFCKKTKT